MKDEKIISKLTYYYLYDDDFFDFCRLYCHSMIGMTRFIELINDYYCDVLRQSNSYKVNSFASGAKYLNSINHCSVWDRNYLDAGIQAHKQKLKQNETLYWLEKYGAPYLSPQKIKCISQFSHSLNFNSERTDCEVHFVDGLFPPIKWKR